MNAIFSYYFSLTYLVAISLTSGSNKSLNFGVFQGFSLTFYLSHLPSICLFRPSHVIYMIMTLLPIFSQVLSPELQTLICSCRPSRQIYQKKSHTPQFQQAQNLVYYRLSPDLFVLQLNVARTFTLVSKFHHRL